MKRFSLAPLLERPAIALGLVLALALAVRLLGIASRPIWYDEAFSVLFSEKGLAKMLVGTLAATGNAAAEEHPLLYYVLLGGWMHVFGESVVAVRALSIVAGLLSVVLIWQLAHALFGLRAAVGAGLIAALSPYQVHYAQEIRMYVFLALWLLAATYAYWRGSHGGRAYWWLAFALFAALAQYTHNLAAFYLLALALWPVLRGDWRTAKWVLIAGVIALLLYLPWLVHLPAQFAKVDKSFWVERPAPYRIFTLFLYFVTNLPLLDWQLAAGLMISVLVVAVGLLHTIKAARARQPDAEQGIWLLYLAFFPAILLFLFSQWIPLYVERALLPSGAVFCIWLAWALLETRAPSGLRSIMACVILAGFGLGLYAHLVYAGGVYAPFRAVDEDIQSRLAPGDVVIHSSKLSMLPAVYFDRKLPQTFIGDPPGSPEDTLAPATQKVLGVQAQPDIQTAAGSAPRVWFLIFDESIQEYVDAGYSTHPQLAWLTQHYSLAGKRQWGTLQVYLFSKAP